MSAHPVSVTVLSDNRAAYGLETEHGLAFWIVAAGRHILFDTGQGEAMTHNADALGVDVGAADAVVLSHGHYDHTGNLPWALARANRARLYLHPEAPRRRYSLHDAPKENGMPAPSVEAVRDLPPQRREWVTAPLPLAEGVWLTGRVPRATPYEDAGGPFFLDAEGRQPDDLPDDLSLWIETPAGLVVCLGCCHAGVVNTLRHITATAREDRVVALLGGTHLLRAPAERLTRTADALAAYAIPHLFPCHCTGERGVACLSERLGSAVQPGYAGMKVTF